MFKELSGLLENRSLTLTVVKMKDGKVRVCVIPQSTEKDEAPNKAVGYKDKEVAKIPDDAISALTTPLSLTGTADELDAQLPAVLASYVSKHVGLQASFDQAAQRIDEAVKAIRETEKSKKPKAGASKPEATREGAQEDTKKTAEGKKTAGDLPSLWCTATTTQTTPVEPAPDANS